MIPVEVVPRIRGERMEESQWRGRNSSVKYLIHCKNFFKCCNGPICSTTIKKTVKQTLKFYLKVKLTVSKNVFLHTSYTRYILRKHILSAKKQKLEVVNKSRKVLYGIFNKKVRLYSHT
jgi:hypothetical protein